MVNKLLKFITSKFFVGSVIIFSQVVFVLLTFYTLQKHYFLWRFILVVLGIIIALHIINRDGDNMFKIGWITLILIQPFVGILFYLMFGNYRIPKRLKNLAKKEKSEKQQSYYHDDSMFLEEIKTNDQSYYRNFHYLSNVANFPIYKNTKTKYLRSGEEKFEVMLEELKKAEKFILIEYFIIASGKMWDQILDILKEKVAQGVEVFVMYDDIGCLTTLPPFYDDELRKMGIRCHVFNPIRITAAIHMNYRNHRKICVIDGKKAITGGVNIADEYINEKKRFGHWRDSAVLIEGEAVWSLTLVFLRFFAYLDNKEIDYFKYKAEKDTTIIEEGYSIPYSDSPTDEQDVGHTIHMNMITNAKEYIYIQSPYVILDQSMQDALILAAQSGVDVRIMIPHIPDKKYVYILTKEYCRKLMRYGVRVYEYLPGFVHAKSFVSDDKTALVGTVNMDYRSYFLHYECGVYFYNNHIVYDVKDDFLTGLEKCREMSYDEYQNVSVIEKMLRIILKIFTPIL